ncbi:MAG: UDP-N-acetylglucosamine--N-acetylmuramyl-(pentapeptide) pyrophosphoryl-undecaprenol N-acetylglucosamine transferase [Phycisphaerae bacterium]|nr:UDP-N-acetylglucosamine--N-acetylmuramyl-(pentapeptide) pyrophosphoryl-undecaprenol N-acetylglucosamine transferase [Phycisphaerae bacterium]
MSVGTVNNPVTDSRAVTPANGSASVVFAGGGTGGHLFPALAVAEAIRETSPNVRFTFFGTSRPFDRVVTNMPGTELISQSIQPLRMKPWTWPTFYVNWVRSRRCCREYFDAHPPVVVIGTGGFASGPPLYEAAKSGIPTVLMNPDAIPGRANRFLAQNTAQVFVQWEETQAAFSGHHGCEVTGCPIRSQFRSASRARGIEHFGLDPTLHTLLVTGASQGAASINNAMPGILNDLAELSGWQILHLSGPRDFEQTQTAYRMHRMPAVVVPFTEQMADAMAAADLIVSRAGASTLAEITALGKPSVLLPYPHHRDMHQHANARVLVKIGAARIVHDRVDPQLTAPAMREVLSTLMSDEETLARMASAANRIGTTDAATKIAARIKPLLGACVEKEA